MSNNVYNQYPRRSATPPANPYDRLQVIDSNNSDTTNTYVDRRSPPPRRKKTKKSKKVEIASDDESYEEYNSKSKNLEGQPELKNEKRLFSWMFSKKVPPLVSEEERKSYPWKQANLLKRMIFLWVWPILIKGYKRCLVPSDLWYLTDNIKVETMHEEFQRHLDKILSKQEKKHIAKHGSSEGFEWPVWSIPLAIYYTFQFQYTSSCIFLGLSFCCQALSPLLTRRLIDFVEYRYYGFEPTLNPGIGYTIGSVVLIFINGLLLNHFFHDAMVTGAQAKAILTKCLLLKSFRLGVQAKHDFPAGRITSMMSTDLARIDLAIGFQPLVVCCPIPVIIAVVLLLTNIGVTSLCGIGLFIVSLVVCILMTKKLFVTRELVVKFTDERITLVRELLSNMKVIKFYAWEMAYKTNIAKVRDQEMKHLFTIKVLRNFITAYAVTLPTLSSMLSFVVLWKSQHMKSPGEVFSSLSLFSILAQAIMLLPIALSSGADALIGFRRCTDFLGSEESSELAPSTLQSIDNASDYNVKPPASDFEFEAEPYEMSEYGDLSNNSNGPVLEVSHADFLWESLYDENADQYWTMDEKEIDRAKKQKQAEKRAKKARKYNKASYSQSRHYDEKTQFDSTSTSDTIYEEQSSGNSSHENSFPGLLDINLSIKRNEFVMITGVIGSGKSSLLSALSGFLKMSNPDKGRLVVNDDLLLCSSPWIQNATVRDNILFGRPYDEQKYRRIIQACALESDLDLLPARDFTEIGERGITLSGGQKSRINLARACYGDQNILLFDDVLSAVDARVGKHIVDNLFYDVLRNRTRVLATHQLSLIENADRIIFLNGDGTIDVGTMDELSGRNMNFRRLLLYNNELPSDDNLSDYDHLHNESVMMSRQQTHDEKSLMRQQSILAEQNVQSGRLIGDEERATTTIGWNIYKRYVQLGSGFFGWSAAPVFIFFVALSTFCQVFTNTWLSWWNEHKYRQLSDDFYVGFYVAFAFLTVILTAVQFTILAYMNDTSARLLNSNAMQSVLHVPMSYMDTTPLGRILNRFSKDTDSIDNEIGEQLRLFIFPLAMIIGIMVLCITYLPYFAIAIPFLGFGFTFLANFYQGSSREIKRLESVQRSLVYNNFSETLSGMATIKAYKVQDTFVKKNDDFLNKTNEAYYLSIATQRWLGVHLDILASMFALIICMLCITEQFSISAASTGLLLNYVIQIVGLLSLTVRSMTQVESEMNSVERLHEYAFHLPQEAAYLKPDVCSSC
ncbi:hypothetical protein PGUG_03562 [Meyerozyma guilliermondii ATCC 6260]|uniref:Oligomycin resistance ATP-dependent permease YOR1 n=1 Tax=Meyerozyma guilliermondii (strain ATCC 6260 / CBS 566 / DSM 6381 / JCM 1539 / NBRC 10279 / NRRL Y-324) TaxID=294746 RepID=A5DJW1_PICGU|nr:uncharacterized protein PGUG_03562 [Meyerozyma guilliermondii ATCC 6260]EDK39464.2 hypothetical protein PGUG_03562 [Meyerozyma guilliermondii ATCC 6260]